MPAVLKHARAVVSGRVHPGHCPMCGPTVFYIRGRNLRNDYICYRCRSVPRQRAFVRALSQAAPSWRHLSIFESSPGGVSSEYIERQCPGYVPSQFFPDVPSGEFVGKVRREDLQAMTLDDSSVDLFLTQDVFEHILDPDAAWREVARVLKPGGMHIWTVPIHDGCSTVRRAEPDGAGGIRHLMEPDFHGNPLGGGSLAIHDWGDDVVDRCDATSGVTTTRLRLQSWTLGIRGPMTDVLVSRKSPARMSV